MTISNHISLCQRAYGRSKNLKEAVINAILMEYVGENG